MKKSTAKEDRQILALHRRGLVAKEIRAALKLSNVMRVYNAIRRAK